MPELHLVISTGCDYLIKLCSHFSHKLLIRELFVYGGKAHIFSDNLHELSPTEFSESLVFHTEECLKDSEY